MSEGPRYRYQALDGHGRRVDGALTAVSEAAAFDELKRKGLAPTAIRRIAATARPKPASRLNERRLKELLFELSSLIEAGADIRSALDIASDRMRDAEVALALRAIGQAVSRGARLSDAMREALGSRGSFVGALAAAGEARGDIAGGLRQASELLTSELAMRSKLVEALSYPVFILVSSLGALLVILVYVIPSLEPLMVAQGGDPPLIMGAMLLASRLLRDWGSGLAILLAVALGSGLIVARAGILTAPLDRLIVDGPLKAVMASFLYGRFAQVLGRLQASGVRMDEAMRLALDTLGSGLARSRLEIAWKAVRQGESLSTALGRTSGFPDAILRLTVIGERTGELGGMLDRAGTLELEGLVRNIERASRVLGPAMIILLGCVIGLMMGGLLSGVSSLGEGL